MARSAVNFKISSSPATPYTVPTAKVLIGKAYRVASTPELNIDGVAICYPDATGVGPITVAAGQTLSVVNGELGFSGFLYDA